MAQNTGKSRSFLTRTLAAMALVAVYCVSLIGTSAVLLSATSTSAEARGGGRGGGGRGRGGGWGRGGGRGWGRGRGFGVYVAPPVRGCYWSRRWGRTVCPY
jgi:hypothetical protein